MKTRVYQSPGGLTLTYHCDRAALARLCQRVLGKTILFTDNHAWKDEEIILGYRGQSQAEEAFRTMKNPHFISIRPMYHWTDPLIRVHAFYCVPALTITSLLVREVQAQGLSISPARLFELLNRMEEVALIWPRPPGRPSPLRSSQPRDTITLSEMTTEQHQIFEALNLRRLAPGLSPSV